MNNYDLIVIGGGPAGMSAAITAQSEGLSTLLIEKDETGCGGQAGESSAIENYFGFPEGINGLELSQRGVDQARKFGTEFLVPSRVARLEQSDGKILVTTEDGNIYPARTVILALGVAYRRLDADGIGAYLGNGVKYGSPSLGQSFEGKRVVVVGGANSAGQAVVHLCRQAGCEVHMVVRNETLSSNMSAYLIDRIKKAPVNSHYLSKVKRVGGASKLEEIVISTPEGDKTISTDEMFIMIGAEPKTFWLEKTVARDEKFFLYTGNDIPTGWWKLQRPPLSMESSMAGVFVAGDVRHGSIRRVASAVAEGAMAVQNIHGYLAKSEK